MYRFAMWFCGFSALLCFAVGVAFVYQHHYWWAAYMFGFTLCDSGAAYINWNNYHV